MSDSEIKDAYAENLAKVNEVSDVIASSDICNAQGQIVAKKGARIDNLMVERIARFKLLKPLEHSIIIENELNAEGLAACFTAFLSSDPSTAYFFKKYATEESLNRLCNVVCQHGLLRQKLTVISLIMPGVFEQAMFCAWFGYLIARNTGGHFAKPEDVFFAAMCHDIGMIHISADILNKTEELTAEEWRQIHVHPIIAFNILKEVKGTPKNVARAVLEHHENIDGTGYPKSKPGTNLSIEGQLINLLDSVNAIYNRRCKPYRRPISDIIPIIQISRHSRFGPLGKKLIVLLRELPESGQAEFPEEHVESIVELVKAHGSYINGCVDIARNLAKSVGFRHENVEISCIQNSIIHISMSIVQSGIINEAYMRWLDQVAIEKLKHAYKEMEEAFLMMQEIIYQINRLKMLITLFLDKHGNTEESIVISERALQLNVQPRPNIQEPLNELWLFSA